MEVDLCFSKNFIDELKLKIPQKILDLNFEFHKKCDPWQYVRFDNGLLNAVYFSVKDKNNKGIGREPVLKFDYINNEFVFKYIYIYEFTDKDGNLIEHRYDSEMNLVSKYKHFPTGILLDNGNEIICRKIKEGSKSVNTNYVFYKNYKDFTKFFDFLEKSKIVINNDKLDNKCYYFVKEDMDVVYLVLTKYIVLKDNILIKYKQVLEKLYKQIGKFLT